MPKPVYIICSQMGSEDRETGLLSVFSIIEKLQITSIPVPQPGQPPPIIQWAPFRVYAVWMKDDGDNPAQDFEFEMNLILPPDSRRFQLASGTLRFEEGKPLRRVAVFITSPLTVTHHPGL